MVLDKPEPSRGGGPPVPSRQRKGTSWAPWGLWRDHASVFWETSGLTVKVTATALTSGLQAGQLPRLPGAEGLQSSWAAPELCLREGDTAARRWRSAEAQSAGLRGRACAHRGLLRATLGGGHAKDGLWVRAWALWVARLALTLQVTGSH